MNKFVEEFLDYLNVERGLTKNTLVSYRRDLNAYMKYLADVAKKDIANSSRDDIREFMFYEKQHGLAPASVAPPVRSPTDPGWLGGGPPFAGACTNAEPLRVHEDGMSNPRAAESGPRRP